MPENFDELLLDGRVHEAAVVVNKSLQKSIDETVPKSTKRLFGPKKCVSIAIQNKIKMCKNIHRIWRDEFGAPGPEHPASVRRKQSNKELRSLMRQEDAEKRNNFFQDVTENTNSSNFHRLLNKQRKNKSSDCDIQLLVDGNLICETAEQIKACVSHYHKLSNPENNDIFDAEHYDSIEDDISSIRTLVKKVNYDQKPITDLDVTKAIYSLKNNKAPDEHGLCSEAFKLTSKYIAPILTKLFNSIRVHTEIPDYYKTGIVTSIPKKGKDDKILDNHRGITITPTDGKILEHIIKDRIKPVQLSNQDDLQLGFTEGLCPSLASLLMSEAIVEARENKENLFICTLDARKAFDSVCHSSLLKKLYDEGIKIEDWALIDSLYSNMSSKIKWKNQISDSFSVNQGVRQGGVISAMLYKSYVNGLLSNLRNERCGYFIGTSFVGAPTVADDVSLMASPDVQLQHMIDQSFQYACRERYLFNTSKCLITAHEPNTKNRQIAFWSMNNNLIKQEDFVDHLGLKVCTNRVINNQNTVQLKINTLNRTTYSLMGTGIHGSNGLSPKISHKIYSAYVLPRVLYGLSTSNLAIYQTNKLETVHLKHLKFFQSLPLYVATPIVYLLIGCLPIEAEIDLQKLSLFGCLTRSNNNTLIDVTIRQLAVKSYSSKSWFVDVSKLLLKYNLPPAAKLLSYPLTKYQFKSLTKKAVHQYWSDVLKQQCGEKSSLRYINVAPLSTSKHHIIWDIACQSRRHAKRAVTKVRLLSGVYIFQSTRKKFDRSSGDINGTCCLCETDIEDITHFLLECPALSQVRSKFYPLWEQKVIKLFGVHQWNRIKKHNSIHVQSILDISKCQVFGLISKLPRGLHRDIEQASMLLCHVLHSRRASLLAGRVYGDHKEEEDITGSHPGGPMKRPKFQRKV